MDGYGEKLASIPGRVARWLAKVLFGYCVVTAGLAWGLHRAFPARTEAAWRSFRAPTAPGPAAQTDLQSEVPPEAVASAAGEVVVYGNAGCGLTTYMKEELTKARVPFRYVDIDQASGMNEVSAKLKKAFGKVGSFGLPVVSVGEVVKIRPSVDAVKKSAKSAR